jgi:threonine aldolase
MSNQVAIRMLSQPQDELICDRLSHIYNYEAGGIASNSLVSARLIDGDRGRITAEQVLENINPPDDYYARTSLVVLENTVNKGGGSIYDLEEIQKIALVCKENQLKIHLDGARLFNAVVEKKQDPKEYGSLFDSISICLSKGLGCPAGTLLLSSEKYIKQARRIRKGFGGGMRQAGFLAAAGIYALDHQVERLMEDHAKARIIASILEKKSFVTGILPVDTNIVIFETDPQIPVDGLLNKLSENCIMGVKFGKNLVRFVTHLHFDDNQLQQFEEKFSRLEFISSGKI